MNIIWGFVAITGGCAVGVTALLLVRRRAPEGGFFGDGDRAAGEFGVLATGFSILIGSVIAVMAALLLLLRGLDQPFHGRRRRAATDSDAAVVADGRRALRSI